MVRSRPVPASLSPTFPTARSKPLPLPLVSPLLRSPTVRSRPLLVVPPRLLTALSLLALPLPQALLLTLVLLPSLPSLLRWFSLPVPSLSPSCKRLRLHDHFLSHIRSLDLFMLILGILGSLRG